MAETAQSYGMSFVMRVRKKPKREQLAHRIGRGHVGTVQVYYIQNNT